MGSAIWISDRWFGKAGTCWACNNPNVFTRAMLFTLLAYIDGDNGVAPLYGYAPFCEACALEIINGGVSGSSWTPPRIRVLLETLLAENPLDGPCDLCAGGKKPPKQGVCICRHGRRALHGFHVAASVFPERHVGGSVLVGPSPGPLYPVEVPYAESGWTMNRVVDEEHADTSGPWDEAQAAVPSENTPEALLERRLARRRPLRDR